MTIAATMMIAAIVGIGAAASADAAAYRYWTYWHGSATGWLFATGGPASTIPADGSVEGWRFAVTTAAGAPGDQPRVVPSFTDVCADTPAEAGRKRVALVIDPGPEDAAPSGQAPGPLVATCVVADPDDNGYQVLRSVAVVRTEAGLVCGISGYPTGECAPVIEEAGDAGVIASAASVAPVAVAAQPTTPQSDAGTGAPWATLLVVVVAGAAGLLFWRRRHG
ncbi:MAG: SCO2322 family protein [Actinomycetota bacterium]|nr:SCO2322 family protein [Actinomycetota bacterium]